MERERKMNGGEYRCSRKTEQKEKGLLDGVRTKPTNGWLGLASF